MTIPTSRRITIIDTTLRDGAQAPGVVFSRDQKRAIARMLADLGVDVLEAGTPVMGPEERGDLRAMLSMNLPCQVVGWCRAHAEDLRQAHRCGLQAVHVGIPVSDLQLAAMGRDRKWVLAQVRDLVRGAARQFDEVSVGAQDATRADAGFLRTVALEAAAAGAVRFRLADTVGVAHPLQTAALVGGLQAAVPCMPIEFHAHNDLGMATANAVTAAATGAQALSVTVNGLGERAGNAALEEVAAALWRCHAGRCDIRLEGLTALSRSVAEVTGRSLPPAKPVVGADVFVHESGIHCDGLLKDARTFEPFRPGRVGQAASRMAAGTHSGAGGIRHMLTALGLSVDPQTAAVLRPAVQRAARCKGGLLSSADLIRIYRRYGARAADSEPYRMPPATDR